MNITEIWQLQVHKELCIVPCREENPRFWVLMEETPPGKVKPLANVLIDLYRLKS
jgi:hypothetical protein